MTRPNWTPRAWAKNLLCPNCTTDYINIIDQTGWDFLLECPTCGTAYGVTVCPSPAARKEAS